MASVQLKPLPPQEAIAYFKGKGGNFPKSWSWQDIWQEEHARAFTVAKSAGFDILSDIHSALLTALQEGQTFKTFAKQLKPLLQDKGWWGKRELANPRTGEKELVQLGSKRRLAIIYDTNLRIAHAVGKWEQIKAVADRRPYLRYTAILDSRTRPLHRSWHGTVLRWDDPWFDTHYPPCGWHCRCSLIQLSEKDLKRYGLEVAPKAPDDGERPWRDKGGHIHLVPNGIDPSFAYHKGKAADQALAFLEQKVAVAPSALKEAGRKIVQLVKANKDTVLAEQLKETLGDVYRQKLEILKEIRGSNFGPLLEHEALAVFHYTGSGYKAINGPLQKRLTARIDSQRAFIASLDNALKKLPAYEGKVYRDIHLTAAQKRRYKPGAVITNRAYTSTTKLPQGRPFQGANTVLIIQSKTGRYIREFSAFGHEEEVLLTRGKKLMILGVQEINGVTEIYAEEV